MTIRNKNKDHLKDHGGVELVIGAVAPTTYEPLQFWTGHPTENALVDLHEFADGKSKTGNPTGGGSWSGVYSGRPELIAELAGAIQVRLTLATKGTFLAYRTSLRKFWRVCDELESTMTPEGRAVDRLKSVRNLTHLHEAAMHRAKFDRSQFGIIRNLFNDTRRLMRLGELVWTTPKGGEPNRQLIPDSHAKALKIGIKRDWQRVRMTWERHDAIRRGKEPDTLAEYQKQDPAALQDYAEQNAILRKNWTRFERIQKATGNLSPTAVEVYDGEYGKTLRKRGLYLSKMRAIAFPTMEEAHIAFHAALMRSGWNPSTLITGIDATLPTSIFPHPKDAKQSVLTVESSETDTGDAGEEFEEFNMQGSKRRARGRLQFCMGLKKDPDSPPNIVAAYLERTKELRAQLHQDVKEAQVEYERLKTRDTPKEAIERQFKRVQTLQQGTGIVWLYVDYRGAINWLDGFRWITFASPESTNASGTYSYLSLVTGRLNAQRLARKQAIEQEVDDAKAKLLALHEQSYAKPLDGATGLHWEVAICALEKTKLSVSEPISVVTPSDFRDIYARWVYIQSGGNILAVMIALGHARLQSTDYYTTNNIFGAENDEAVRRFMTHLFDELSIGRLDLTILSQLVRHGTMTDEMLARMTEYRNLTRSRVKVACADIRNPPAAVDPGHVEGNRCGTHRCLKGCTHARFLPESLDGIAMRVEELIVISDHTSVDAWIKGGFDKELEAGEYLLGDLYPQEDVEKARTHWRERIYSAQHAVPGVGLVRHQEAA